MASKADRHLLHAHIPRIAIRLWPASGTRDHCRGGMSMRHRWDRGHCAPIDSTVSPLAEEVLTLRSDLVNELGPLREAHERTYTPDHSELVRRVCNDREGEGMAESVQGPATVELVDDHFPTSRCEASVGRCQED